GTQAPHRSKRTVTQLTPLALLPGSRLVRSTCPRAPASTPTVARIGAPGSSATPSPGRKGFGSDERRGQPPEGISSDGLRAEHRVGVELRIPILPGERLPSYGFQALFGLRDRRAPGTESLSRDIHQVAAQGTEIAVPQDAHPGHALPPRAASSPRTH